MEREGAFYVQYRIWCIVSIQKTLAVYKNQCDFRVQNVNESGIESNLDKGSQVIRSLMDVNELRRVKQWESW